MMLMPISWMKRLRKMSKEILAIKSKQARKKRKKAQRYMKLWRFVGKELGARALEFLGGLFPVVDEAFTSGPDVISVYFAVFVKVAIWISPENIP